MKSFTLTVLLSVFGYVASAQSYNYEPSRQTVRMDLGMMIFSDINKVGFYWGADYEYAFMDHFAASATLTSSLRNPMSATGGHASRIGGGLNIIGRLYGLKSP